MAATSALLPQRLLPQVRLRAVPREAPLLAPNRVQAAGAAQSTELPVHCRDHGRQTLLACQVAELRRLPSSKPLPPSAESLVLELLQLVKVEAPLGLDPEMSRSKSDQRHRAWWQAWLQRENEKHRKVTRS